MTREHIEAVATEIATKATYSGGATGFLGWMMNSQVLGLIGLCVAIAGFLVNWYYKHKHYKLAEKQLSKITHEP